MSAIDAIGIEARHVLLEVMMAMAWADRQLQPEERQAAQAAAIALGLVLPADRDLTSPDRRPIPPEELEVAALPDRDRDIIYVCAAWMAMADSVEQPEEAEMLRRLRRKLAVPEDRAQALERRAVELRARQAATKATWWRSFDRLVVEAVRALEAQGS